MFRRMARLVGGADALFNEPAPFIAARLELAWAARPRARTVSGPPLARVTERTGTRTLWDHLIYAYMIENTRAAEIFRRVVYEAAHGERLGVLQSALSYTWLRTTEDLLHSFGVPGLSFSTVSQLRPDPGATRRNAYFRMFGMDLNHSSDIAGGTYQKAADANREFVATFEAFLRDTWRGIENANNSGGPNPTDSAAIADQALRLQNMLNERRGGSATGPNLAREEFVAILAMSWLHLTLDSNNTVVNDLRITAASPEERLRRLGERVGIPAHAHSHSYFILGPELSRLLIAIENGFLSTPAQAETLYLPAPPAVNPRRNLLMSIIEQWTRATGREIKARSVSATPTLGMVGTTATRPVPASVSSSNGSSPVAKVPSPV
jgi:hypothetical protein